MMHPHSYQHKQLVRGCRRHGLELRRVGLTLDYTPDFILDLNQHEE
jgi:hypothetical protein